MTDRTGRIITAIAFAIATPLTCWVFLDGMAAFAREDQRYEMRAECTSLGIGDDDKAIAAGCPCWWLRE